MVAVCDHAMVLRDAIVEYQVGVNLEAPDRPVEFFADARVVRTTKGDI